MGSLLRNKDNEDAIFIDDHIAIGLIDRQLESFRGSRVSGRQILSFGFPHVIFLLISEGRRIAFVSKGTEEESPNTGGRDAA
jgi:hypothetical protein